MLKVCVVGLCGRMGHTIFDCTVGLEGIKIVCGIDRQIDNAPLNCSVEIKADPYELSFKPDIFIDFSRPDCSLKVLAYAREHKIPVVLGTTGFDEDGKAFIKDCAKYIPIVHSANFSVGVNVILSLVQKTAATMIDADIEIVEAHHRYKVDAPSGTALALGEAAATGLNVNLKDVMVAGRNGITGQRNYGTIGFSSIRGGDIVGEHKAMFCCDGERVEIGHIATSRDTFARGALRAAMWLEGKKNGVYSMKEVLDL